MSIDDDAMQLIEDCENREDRLDDWSVNFIDSVRRQIESGKSLTLNQRTKLDEVWERATKSG